MKLKAGDVLIDADNTKYTHVIKKVTKQVYTYDVYFDGFLTVPDMKYSIKAYKNSGMRFITKLEKAMK